MSRRVVGFVGRRPATRQNRRRLPCSPLQTHLGQIGVDVSPGGRTQIEDVVGEAPTLELVALHLVDSQGPQCPRERLRGGTENLERIASLIEDVESE